MQSSESQLIFFLIITTLLIVILIMVVLGIILVYQQKQLAFNEKLFSIQMNYENSKLQTHIDIQEQTLEHISREIHDNIGLTLSLAKLNLLSNNKIENINSAVENIGVAIHDLKNLSNSLNKNNILSLGLLEALRIEIDRVRGLNMFQIHFLVADDVQIHEHDKEIIIFRIIQESLNNIIKHSGAKNVEINFDQSNIHYEITIRDDGRGFNPDSICNNLTSGQSGLINITNRLKIYSGEFKISSDSTGTILKIKLPK